MTNELIKKALLEKALLKKAEDFIKKSETAVISSIGENGYPRAAAMSNIKPEGLKTLWFSTGTKSHKTRNLKENPKASVCFFNSDDNITLIGDVKIIEDMEIKKQLWLDWFINHFPLGVTDPNYCVLKFEAKYIQVYLGNEFEEFNIE